METSESFNDISKSKLRKKFYHLDEDIRKMENAYSRRPDWYNGDIKNICNSLAINLADTKGYIFSFDNPDHAYGSSGITQTAKENMYFVMGNYKRLIDALGMHNHVLLTHISDGINCINNYVEKKTKELESIVV